MAVVLAFLELLDTDSSPCLCLGFPHMADQLFQHPFQSSTKPEVLFLGNSDRWPEKISNRKSHCSEITKLNNNGGCNKLLIPSSENHYCWNYFSSLLIDYPPTSINAGSSYKAGLNNSLLEDWKAKAPLLRPTNCPSSTTISPCPALTTIIIHKHFLTMYWKTLVILAL